MYVTHQLEGEHGLVSVGEVGVHGHDHAVGDDGQDDAVLKRSAVDQPLHQPPDGIGGSKDEHAAGSISIHLQPSFLPLPHDDDAAAAGLGVAGGGGVAA